MTGQFNAKLHNPSTLSHDDRPLASAIATLFVTPVPTDEEKKLVKIKRYPAGAFDQCLKAKGRDEWLIERKTRDLKREQRESTGQMTGDPRFELRESVKKSLTELEKPDKSHAAGH